MKLTIIHLYYIVHLSRICYNVSGSQSSSSFTSRSTQKSEDKKSEYPFNSPNPFVSESPIAIAAVCADGIAMLAIHDTKPEPLLYPRVLKMSPLNETQPETNCSEHTDPRSEKMSEPFFHDLPTSSRAPIRIEPVDSYGSAIVAAGWRTDCNTLASKVRDFAAKQLERYDTQEILNTDPRSIALEPYGRYLSHSAANWLASCAFSQKLRGMSCVGLLAVAGEKNTDEGHLWLIDTTGAYPVRAHAVGYGARSVNRRLMRINFNSMKCEEAILLLLKIIRDEDDMIQNRDSMFVEMAKVESSFPKLQRMRIPKGA